MSPAPGTTAGGEAALRRLVAAALPGAGAEPEALEAVETRFLASATSYPTAAVTARLRGGGALRLFLKDFGQTRLPKDGIGDRRRREIHVYRDLLAGSGLGTPRYHGSLLDEREGRLWLLLELVDGVQLRESGFAAWLAAAAWLARLHARFADRAAELGRSPLLVRHDEDYFRRQAERARRELRLYSSGAGRRAEDLLAGYGELAAAMAGQPPTLVHGNFRAKNVVVRRSSSSLRIAPVDWEVAALGSPLYDLGHLLDGFRGERLGALLDAYRSQTEALGAPLAGEPEASRLMDAYCLHRVVKSLARAREKGFGEGDVGDLLEHGEGLRERIEER